MSPFPVYLRSKDQKSSQFVDVRPIYIYKTLHSLQYQTVVSLNLSVRGWVMSCSCFLYLKNSAFLTNQISIHITALVYVQF
jgi:hypothetical protein